MYFDGFVLAAPSKNREAYRELAENAAAVFKEYGALSVVEGWGDDVPEGKVNSLRTAVLLQPEETVVFSWIAWPDKATRDAAWAKVMQDPRMQHDPATGPFDGKRMIYGGFEALVVA